MGGTAKRTVIVFRDPIGRATSRPATDLDSDRLIRDGTASDLEVLPAHGAGIIAPMLG
ncbi:uncharacterized protein K460DRAFT_366944 [Cucurbitaria berberidis CBS 394.84]|uniref:Uncharacterized protein n=1 Tax=Cucurbitaria berberidis CBS 394.84 TaxID=1168544 RepID=A0A9P4GHA5_9PLEO|nr:uncharacterized protein K460DRAFT_366944 [Cucurbitaria berberidis CBS 394.84]KAF1846118.1 hypothetical protein K460DRAFT_366944 [Cucurbitaria berberidis CBS 394.84]